MSGIYDYVKHPGESLDTFMRRNRIHPDDGDNAREATPEEEAESDKTSQFLEGGFTLFFPTVPD